MPRMRWHAFLSGVTLALVLWAIVALILMRLAYGADGLPEDVPDLYNTEIVMSYRLVKQAPYHHNCRVTVLTVAGYSQAQRQTERRPLLFVIGYLTELRHNRIVVIVETFIHGEPPFRRSLRVWYDASWMVGKSATGEWKEYAYPSISAPMTKDETRTYLQPLYELLAKRPDSGE